MSDQTEAPELDLEHAQQLLQQKTVALLKAEADTITGLTREIQKLRVICQMLREIETGTTDPNTYREMSLLNRMVAGHDLEAEAEKAKLQSDQGLVERLEGRGIRPDSALRIARVLQSVMMPKEDPVEEAEEGEGAA